MNATPAPDSLLTQYAEGPAILEFAIAGLQDADLDFLPAQGGWTIRQIAHHIVDGDDLWKACIKAALGNEQGEFTLEWYWALTQVHWANRWSYAQRSLDVSLALFKANRAHVLQLLRHIPDGWSRSIGFRTPSGAIERMQVSEVIEDQANHVVHHVSRILAIRREILGA